MKTPTLEEMKLAVALLLPEEIELVNAIILGEIQQETGFLASKNGQKAQWKDTKRFVENREWLHVCWLAEQSLTRDECYKYHDILLGNTVSMANCAAGNAPYAGRWTFHDSAEQRLEALCRVKFPEMFPA